MNLSGENVLILGAGGSGLAAARLAAEAGARVTLVDQCHRDRLSDRARELVDTYDLRLRIGDAAAIPPADGDLIVTSPGIDTIRGLGRVYADWAAARRIELIGEVEFGYRFRPEWRYIGITGTNGKTTTTELVTATLRAGGLNALAAGNIGRPLCDVISSKEQPDMVVLELSSFQLETTFEFSPEVVVWMNFAADHMDRYASLEGYYQAKRRIFSNTTKTKLVLHRQEEAFPLNLPVRGFSAFSVESDYGYTEGKLVDRMGKGEPCLYRGHAELQGLHNAENAMVAMGICDHLGIDRCVLEELLTSFRPPRHRCEKVAVLNGVTYLNDSKSTNLHSLESALRGQEEPVVLIAGGKEKGLEFSELNAIAAERVSFAILIGEVREKVKETWKSIVPTLLCDSIAEAVEAAAQRAKPDSVVLFSPGTSSFDMFSGYEERGETFVKAVERLI